MSKWLVVVVLLISAALGGWYVCSLGGDAPEGVSGGVYENATADQIVLHTPRLEAVVTAPFTIAGEARGPWYFEASFPVSVLDGTGNILVQLPATAQGEWMTEEKVPFVATIDTGDYVGAATLVLKKDNPSGMPEFDASYSISITIAAPDTSEATSTEETLP